MADFFISTVIVAGGGGTRMGRPKQLLDIAGTPCLYRSINAFKGVSREIIVVSGPEILKKIKKDFKNIKTAPAGNTRLKSVINGVKAVSKRAEVVLVHDGARPLVNPENVKNAARLAFERGASVMAVPVKDTIKQVENGVITKTLDRGVLYAAQTPQCYRTEILKKALKKYGHEENATDESQLVEKTGVKIIAAPSDYKNIKITTPEDLPAAECFVKDRKEIICRTGFGFDLHRLEKGRKLFIGGLEIPHDKGFLGHSDGDVVLHAVCDAALGAACAGEIGVYFPPTDKKIKGISSVEIAKKVIAVLKEKNAEIVHVDATIITEEPKMKPHYAAVRESLDKIFKIGIENISFKSKSHEKLGDIGAGNAAACHCVATIKMEK